jgi:peroxiredoxin
MPRIVLVLPVAAVLLAGMSAWKLTRPPAPPVNSATDPALVRKAPLFVLYDTQNQPVRLAQRYVGRSKLLVVFFQATESFDDSPALRELRTHFDTVYRQRPAILAIGQSQSGVYRRWLAAEKVPLPFPVFSDVLDAQVFKAWGAMRPRAEGEVVTDELNTMTESSQVPCEAVFIVDRAGWIRHSHVAPNIGTAAEWARELGRLW